MTGQQRGYECFGKEFEGTVLLTGEAAVFYFTGFYTTARRPKQIGYTAVLLSGGVKKFLFPEKWRAQIEEQHLPDAGELVSYANTPAAYRAALKELLQKNGSEPLWLELEETDVPTYLELKELAGDIQNITPKLAAIRLIKSPEEIRRLRHAAKVAVDAMEYAKTILKPGMRELEAVAAIEYHMRKNGSDGVPFTMKLLSGDNSSVVTRVPGQIAIQRGDLVLLDFGARCGGYSSDWTRTFCMGESTKEQREMYDLVWKMERECIGMIKPGLSFAALLEKACEIADGHPYGSYFNPHLGHSVGINSHEWPIVEPGVSKELILEENMVITVEPGIYIPGIGGVRIEDEILVTASGYELLTGLKTEGLIIESEDRGIC